jgi:hypothetical protein
MPSPDESIKYLPYITVIITIAVSPAIRTLPIGYCRIADNPEMAQESKDHCLSATTFCRTSLKLSSVEPPLNQSFGDFLWPR